ncbi:IclR family transcriptional regulator [Rathayibacter sp. ZW T2_19]|uniref:IclR family transcriptional regulator n=1 Tax=Rathayibacter rubneri TaxID=2950106 RepID=A0A9X2DY75_9MICO|nr:IclR family transcriptional regulator [Rathayibacter rubneri]MCM6762849.1 IclR family transcriptional regulator [Rathayibacter rubneri]
MAESDGGVTAGREEGALDPARASTTERVAHVLLALGTGGRRLGVSELSRELGLSKAVVHRILQTLVTCGLVAFDASARRYRLGPAAVALGRAAERDSELREAAMPVIAHLAAVTGETTTLSARVGHRRFYVGQVESSQPIRITITIGEHLGLAVGASGHAILAHLGERDVDLVLSEPVPSVTSRTMVDPVLIRERLALIRERGWAESEGERVRESSSISAPVFDVSGDVVGALSIAFLASRLDTTRKDAFAELVRAASREASESLGRLQAR